MSEKTTFNRATMDQFRDVANAIRRTDRRNGAAQIGICLYVRDVDDPEEIYLRPIEFEDAAPDEAEMTKLVFGIQKKRPDRAFFHRRPMRASDYVADATDEEVVDKVSLKSYC